MYPNTYDKILYEICKNNQIKIEKFKDESLYKLTKDDSVHFIWSRRFDINTTLSCRIADNKYATYLVLNSSNIPAVPCIKIPRIDTEEYLKLEYSIYEICYNLLNEVGTIVIKPNNSYEGTDVFKCKNLKEVESVLFHIEKKYKYLVISPYIHALAEYRLFFLDNQILYAYKKERMHIICDGVSTVAELLMNNKINLSTITPDIYLQFNKIYPQNHKLQLNWKFNLSQGAKCIPIENTALCKELTKIAVSAANAINIRFATIDILVDEFNNKQVLEINAGVAMDQFIIQNPNGIQIATSIYEKAIISMFKR